MNKVKHTVFFMLLIFSLVGLQEVIQQNRNDMQFRPTSNNGWDEALVPLWSSAIQNTENYQFGPVLIVLLAIFSVFGILKYYYSKEELDHEY